MNNKGFISIIVLLTILGIAFILSFNIEMLLDLQKLEKMSLNKLKAASSNESKILMGLYGNYYEEEIYPYLKYRNHASSKNFKLEDKFLINKNKNKNIKLTRKDFILNIETYSKINDVSLCSEGEVDLINPIFLDGNYKDRDLERFWDMFYEKLNDVLYSTKGEKDDIYEKIIDSEGTKYLYSEEDYNVIEDLNGLINYFPNKKIKVFMLSKSESPLIICQKEGYPLKYMEGILVVDGSIKIKSDFDFKGIIICKNGKLEIDEGVSFSINGVLISKNVEIREYTKGDKNNPLHIYGYYLPGLIDPKLINIKYKG